MALTFMDRCSESTFVWANLAMPQSDRLPRVCGSDPQFDTANQRDAAVRRPATNTCAHVRSSVKPRFSLYVAFHLCRLSALIAVGIAMMSSGCGTEHATLSFTAPSSATAGVPFSMTVTVLYKGMPDTIINSPIHFTSSDPAAVLPPDYYFTAADAGSHTWANGFALSTPGNQTISGAIFNATGINGSATVRVSP
jgi:hypothetical protein